MGLKNDLVPAFMISISRDVMDSLLRGIRREATKAASRIPEKLTHKGDRGLLSELQVMLRP